MYTYARINCSNAVMRGRIMFGISSLFLCYLLCLSQLINALPQPDEVTSSSTSEGSKEHHTLTVELTKSKGPLDLDGDAGGDNNIISDPNNNNNSSEGSERDKLLFYTLEQFDLLSSFTVEHGANVLRNVLKEGTVLKESTETLKSHLRDFSDYVERAEHLEKRADDVKPGELYDMVVLFTELVEQHNATVMENATTENLYLEMSLKQNGLDKLQVDFLERFLLFADKLNARIDSYLEKLTAEQQVTERKMIEWYGAFNDETDSEKKVEIFANFFELYA